MEKNLAISKFVWVPRIAAIVFILFLMLFSLDVLSGNGEILGKIGGFLIQSLPSILMAVFLAFCWNRPLVCGWFFIGIAVFLTFWARSYSRIDLFLLITAPSLVIGALFLVAARIGKKRKSGEAPAS